VSTFNVHIDLPEGCSPFVAPEALRVLADSLTFDGVEAGSGWVRDKAGEVVGNWWVGAAYYRQPLVYEG
jgi:hypothetical protein